MFPEKKQVLVVDDEPNLRKILAAQLSRDGYDVSVAEDGEQGLQFLRENHVDLVITDLKMPKVDGMTLLKEALRENPELPIVMITAHGTVDTAVEALKTGAFDYLTKPFDKDEVRQIVAKALRTRQLADEDASAPQRAVPGARFGIIGKSPQLTELYAVLERVADSPTTVLITGESGTGKELVARALHDHSTRKDKPFIKVNCAAIPKELIESELFGYERGAFSGALSAKPGLIESADTGTLFLDEIGELPLSTQTKLLRVLETHEVPRLGSLKAKHVDFRLIAATNKNLRAEIAAGRFRADLYYRINGLSITIPPLRERKNELPYLAALFAARAARQLKKNEPFFDREALLALEAYDWPGNVRELKSVVERAVLLCRAGTVLTEHLPADVLGPSEWDMDDIPTLTLRNGTADLAEVPKPTTSRSTMPPPARPAGHAPPPPPSAPTSSTTMARGSLKEETDRLEYERIMEALQRFQGNQSRAAEALGMTRRALIVRLDRFRIPRPRKQDAT